MAADKHITYSDIQMYLEGIANNPANKRDVDDSNHGRFWSVSYQSFISGVVPGESCRGNPIPIVDKDPAQCAFYQALKNPSGWCSLAQMPKRGPYITDAGYAVTLSNGKAISGSDIDADIVWWLTHGMPEK